MASIHSKVCSQMIFDRDPFADIHQCQCYRWAVTRLAAITPLVSPYLNFCQSYRGSPSCVKYVFVCSAAAIVGVLMIVLEVG